MKKLTADSLGARLLAGLAQMILRHRKWFLYPQLLLFVVCVLYTVKFLEFDTSRNNLVGSKKKYHQNFLNFKKEFPTQDDVVVVVESENPEKNRQFVERLGAKLEAEPKLFKDVFYKGDLKMLGSKALLFVPEKDLLELKQKLHDFQPFVEQFTHTTNLVSLFQMINTQFRTAKQERNEQNESLAKALPALERILAQARYCLRRPGVPPSPGVMALFDDSGQQAEKEIYITFADGQIFVVTAQAPTDDLNDDTVIRLRELVEETRVEVPGLNVGVTGEPVLEVDEMAQSQKDTTLASIVSLVICALIFIYGYNETGRPLKATLCLIIGLGYTMAFTTLTVHHLNILTITFVPILIGLAIDFGVHLVTRYEEELRHGRTEEEAITTSLVFTGQGIFTGAFTTAGAFLAMWFTDFKGIQEMGIICGGGLLVCLIPMMTMLPVLLLRGRQNVIDHHVGDKMDRRERIENLWLQRPKTVVVITIALCTLCAFQIKKVYFDYNLLNMQSAGLPAVVFEEKLINASTNISGSVQLEANHQAIRPANAATNTVADTSADSSQGRSVLFAAMVADSVEEAARLAEQVKKLPTVADVDSVATYLVENPTNKLKLIREIKASLQSLHFPEPDPKAANLDELSSTLYSTGGYLGLAREAVQAEDPAMADQFKSLRTAMERLRQEMLRGSADAVQAKAVKLGAFQQALFNDLRETFEALRNQDDSGRLRIEDLPPALRHRFVGVTGKQLLQIYPKENVWQRDHQQAFVDDLRKVDPNVTGTPVQLLEYTTLLKDSYVQAAWYSLAAITVLVLIHFRTIGSVILSLLPVAIGSMWLAGLMGYFDIPLNPANIMTLPLVIGIGVTNGIHILNRFAEEQTPSILAKSTGKAVLVSGLTTIAGFGSLAFAKHRGIESLGTIMATGVAACMIAGLTFLPALLNLMMQWKPTKKQPSADNARSALGREEPR